MELVTGVKRQVVEIDPARPPVGRAECGREWTGQRGERKASSYWDL